METVTKYVVDGVEYNSYQAALQAEESLKEEKLKVFNPSKEVLAYERQGEKLLKNITRNSPYPLLLEMKEKHGNYVYAVIDEQDLKDKVLKILQGRVNDGYWYYDEDEMISKEIVKEKHAIAAFMFLVNRQDYEYEFVDLRSFDKL